MEDKEIKDLVLTHFATTKVSSVACKVVGFRASLSEEAIESLNRPCTGEEIWFALRGMHTTKTPGLDGIQPIFYQRHWEVVGNSITNMVISCFESVSNPQSISKSFITLIPKVDNTS